MWTRFMDMHSGGSCKESPYEYIYIEAPEDEAKVIFYNRFGHNPERVTCTCCGEDYSISDGEDLSQLTGYDRGCDYVDDENNKGHYVEKHNGRSYSKYETLDKYKERKNVLMISESEINGEERKGEVPEQGYVWVD